MDSTGNQRSLTWDNISRTYTGLLDDVMIRYSRDYANEDFFNRMIIKNVLFGGGIFINDGYLVNHEIARKHLTDDTSLLRFMLNTDFIRVLTRTQSKEELRNMPKKMAKENNESFKRLVNSNEWTTGFESLWSRISNSLYRNNNPRSWPSRHMGEGFDDLVQRVFPSDPRDVGLRDWTPEQLDTLKSYYYAENPRKANSRDCFEKAALRTLTGNPTTSVKMLNPRQLAQMMEIMDIANQAYHYNFGLTLTEETSSTEEYGVAVDTTIGKAFDELLLVDEVKLAQLEQIPVLKLPDNVPLDQGPLFYSFLDPVSKVSMAKISYLDSLNELIQGNINDLDELRRRVLVETSEYGARIAESLKLRQSDVDGIFTATLGVANVDGSSNVPVVASNNPVFSIGLAKGDKRLDLLTRLFKVTDITEQFGRDGESEDEKRMRIKELKKRSVTLDEIRPQISSVAFTFQAALEHSSKLTKFD